MQNKSGLKPVGRAVLVQLYEPERAESPIEIPGFIKEKSAMVEQRAVVVEAGAAAWEDESAPRAIPGDKVLITRFAGFMARGTADGLLYRLVNDRDIFCKIEHEEVLS